MPTPKKRKTPAGYIVAYLKVRKNGTARSDWAVFLTGDYGSAKEALAAAREEYDELRDTMDSVSLTEILDSSDYF